MDALHETPTAPGRPLPALAHAALGALAFLVAAAGVRAALPRPLASDLAIKLDRFEELADRVDTLFIGSSVVHRQVDPAQFDRLLAERGIATRSFNLGVRMMSTLEATKALRGILDGPRRLEHIVIECRHLGVGAAGENELTVRFVAWHDLRATIDALRALAVSERSKRRKLSAATVHLLAFARRAVNLGSGPPALGPKLDPEEGAWRRSFVLGPRRDGFSSLDWAVEQETASIEAALAEGRRPRPADLDRRESMFSEQLENFDERVDRLVEAGPREVDLPPEEELLFREIVELADDAGIEIAFLINCDVIHPVRQVASRGPLLRELARRGVVPRLVDLGRPDDFPELYAPERRFDWTHLDQEGASLFTERLAEEYLRGRERE